MRKTFIFLVAATLLITAPAFAYLQNVEVGGSIRIRGNYFQNAFTDAGPEVRWPAGVLGTRPIGGFFGNSVASLFDWDDNGDDLDFVEQRTRLNVTAEFTDGVSAFIELDSYDEWGEDFRSDYLTGVDGRAASVDDVEVYQAYIQANEVLGYPVNVRIGRQ